MRIAILILFLVEAAFSENSGFNPDGRIGRPSFHQLSGGAKSDYARFFGSYGIDLPTSENISLSLAYMTNRSGSSPIHGITFAWTIYEVTFEFLSELLNPDGVIGSYVGNPVLSFTTDGHNNSLIAGLEIGWICNKHLSVAGGYAYNRLNWNNNHEILLGTKIHCRNKAQLEERFNPDGSAGTVTIATSVSYLRISETSAFGLGLDFIVPVCRWLTSRVSFHSAADNFVTGVGLSVYP